MKKLIFTFLPCVLFMISFTAISNEPPPPDSQHMRRGDKMSMSPRMRDDFMKNLSEEDREKFRKLATENPEEFKKELLKYIHEARKKEMMGIMALRSKYLNATDETTKNQAKSEIEAALRKQFNHHMGMTERRIKETESQLEDAQKKLEHFRKDYENRKRDAEKIIAQGVADFTNPDKEPRLDPPPRKGKNKDREPSPSE